MCCSPELNVTSVTSVTSGSLTLVGLVQLYDHRWLFFAFFLLVYLFLLGSDTVVVYVICSQRNLHRPMFVFIAALLLNSMAGSVVIYPKLLLDLASGRRSSELTPGACVCQAFMVYSLGGSGFLLLASMALDRYLSICCPLRYAMLLPPAAVTALLLMCWLLPAAVVGGAALLMWRIPLCRFQMNRLYCNIYSFVSLSCGSKAALLLNVYGLVSAAVILVIPVLFVFFSYGRVLAVCLRSSRSFSSKALNTCLPHLLVFINYFVSVVLEMALQRLEAGVRVTTIVSIVLLLVPTLFNPVVYGLKMKEIFVHVKRLLSCSRAQ